MPPVLSKTKQYRATSVSSCPVGVTTRRPPCPKHPSGATSDLYSPPFRPVGATIGRPLFKQKDNERQNQNPFSGTRATDSRPYKNRRRSIVSPPVPNRRSNLAASFLRPCQTVAATTTTAPRRLLRARARDARIYKVDFVGSSSQKTKCKQYVTSCFAFSVCRRCTLSTRRSRKSGSAWDENGKKRREIASRP